MTRISSEEEMLAFARDFAKNLEVPSVIELIGDVGAGKTTFTRGLAEGLGVTEPVTSPSFTISKRYTFSRPAVPPSPTRPITSPDIHSASPSSSAPTPRPCTLIHYDFYRLPDPGLMSEDLEESLADENAITVVEWANSVSSLLPENRIALKISLNPDASRTIEKI